MDISEKIARLKFSQLKGFKFSNFLEIIDKFETIENFFNVNPNLSHSANTQRDLLNKLEDISPNNFVVYGEDDYPKLLADTPYPPIALFYKGDISLCNKKNLISIVGTRKHSNYGERVTKNIVEGLGKSNFVFISGMALGIDTLVHKYSLVNKYKTIAVIPSSLEKPMPISNRRLFDQIAEEGLVFTECLNNFIWNKSVYAKRNRIIAGLSPSTIVIEAPKKSGSLITANLAFEYNREVYAVPGNIDSTYSIGTNKLIKDLKAQLFSGVGDIIPGKLDLISNTESNEILNLLKVEQLDIEQISTALEMDINTLRSDLLELEINGQICLNADGKYNIKLL
jgi:DNA processing protein